MKRILSVCSLVLCLSVCFCLCFSLVGCKENYDKTALHFYRDTRDGAYNAIKLNLGENFSGYYFIEQGYGILSGNGIIIPFEFDYISIGQGSLWILTANKQSYVRSFVECGNGLGACYYGTPFLSGHFEFSDDETVAKISSDRLSLHEEVLPFNGLINETITMTKVKIPTEEIVSFETALEEMHYVPDEYFDFIANREQAKYSCDAANFWVDGATMTGEWNTNGTIVPIRMQLNDKVPYFEIFDISGETEKSILKAYVDVSDATTLKLTDIEGCIFYTKPTASVFLTKTTK